MTWLMFIFIIGSGNAPAMDNAPFHTKLGCDTAALAVGTQYQEALRNRGSNGTVLILCVPNEKLTM